MHNLRWLIGLLSLLFSSQATHSQHPRVELPGTQVVQFTSAINSQKYELYIELPGSYSDTTKSYPVLYALDGEWEFPLVSAINGGLHNDGYIPEMIVVGIGWPDDYENNRKRDFSSVAIPGDPFSGGGPKFLRVIKEEVIKLVDSSFRSDRRNNTLYGGSLAGYFALYTLFHEPALFNRYVVCSPSLQWDDEITFKYERGFAEKNHALPVKIMISSSQTEEEIFPVSNYKRFIDQLRASKYKGLELEGLVVDQMSHSSEGPYALGRGLEFVFNKPSLQMDTLLLDRYAGHYEQDWVITRTGNSLYISLFGGKARLYAETYEKLYLKGAPLNCVFQKDKKGKVTGVDLTYSSNATQFLRKLD